MRWVLTLSVVGGSVSAMNVPATTAVPLVASIRSDGVAVTARALDTSVDAGATAVMISGRVIAYLQRHCDSGMQRHCDMQRTRAVHRCHAALRWGCWGRVVRFVPRAPRREEA